MAKHEKPEMDVIESCVIRVLESALGPLYKKETRNTHKVTFALQLETSFGDNIEKKQLESTAERYATHLMGEILKKADNPKDCELLQHYVDNLIQSVLKCSIPTAINRELCRYAAVADYAENLAEAICEKGVQSMSEILRQNLHVQMISDFSDQFVIDNLLPTIQKCDHIIKFSEGLSTSILEEAKATYCKRTAFREKREVYANGIANFILSSSYEENSNRLKEPTNQLYNCFADGLINPILNEVLTTENNNEQLVYSVFISNKPEQPALISNEQTNQRNTLKLPLENGKAVSHVMHRRDSSDGQSDALTPRSVTEENNWKRGLYHFADELLYSLSILENEASHDIFNSLDAGSSNYARVKRSGSCPIVRIPPTLFEGKSYRRQSETSIRFTGGVIGFADNMACSILRSTVPNYSCVH